MSAKYSCQTIAALLRLHDVRDVVLSPGSRNLPIIQAIDEEESLRKHIVIDERSAAFMALGMAQADRRPVAVVCTSGTALLNYAPAVAEAFYQHLPLIVISADRPGQWIDQDDSQTIRQPGALANFVKYSCDLPDYDDPSGEMGWYARRCVNDALLAAVSPDAGPVHINVQLSEPLLCDFPVLEDIRPIRCLRADDTLTREQVKELAVVLRHKKVMVVAGFMSPSSVMSQGLTILASLPNVVVLAETTANVYGRGIFHCVDRILTLVNDGDPVFTPDIVITVGGPLVSRHLKAFLRAAPGVRHWSVGHSHVSADVFKHLEMRINASADKFIHAIADALAQEQTACTYAAAWHSLRVADNKRHDKRVSLSGWSSLKAFATFWPMIQPRTNVQLSNGTCVRYAQLFYNPSIHSCHCNRGVSGIDGCTSTAVGASMIYEGITLLVTGDMSFAYDSGALALPAPDRFKIIVMNNGGGGIFRFIKATRSYSGVEKYLCADPHLQVRNLAELSGYAYFRVESEEQLRSSFEAFMHTPSRAILEIVLPPDLDAKAITDYFRHE